MVQELRNSPAPARDQSDSDSPASDLDAFLDRFTSVSFTTEAPGEEERRQRGMAAARQLSAAALVPPYPPPAPASQNNTAPAPGSLHNTHNSGGRGQDINQQVA